MPDPWSRLVAIVRANQYMTLATADAEGRPWSSPVWFATDDCREFVWVSAPGARHSRNLAVRPDLAITIFDSRQPAGTGDGVYLAAVATQLTGAELDAGLAVYAAASERAGLPVWTRADVQEPARHRLYRASAVESFVLSDRDERIPVHPAG